MDVELKLALGKILGETYKIQEKLGISEVSDGTIYGLINGFQEAIDNELGDLEYVSNADLKIVTDYLSPYWKKEKPLKELHSFTQIRLELERKGVSHARLLSILKYLHKTNRFTEEIDKIVYHMD